MNEQTDENDATLTVAEVSELVGDDVAYWMQNPFMTPEMLTDKVCWWVTRAVAATRVTDEAGRILPPAPSD